VNSKFKHPPQPDDWDGDWQCISYDPLERISEWWLHSDDAKKITIRRIQHNIDALLNHNATARSQNFGKRWGNGQIVARVPVGLWHDKGLSEAHLCGDSKFVHKFLNDADNGKLRTFEGNL